VGPPFTNENLAGLVGVANISNHINPFIPSCHIPNNIPLLFIRFTHQVYVDGGAISPLFPLDPSATSPHPPFPIPCHPISIA